ncbi:MAG: patatin-like phospholipase family protein [Saprospirales bacterium]|nr:patatin-like phospholipase family protein [Saprospirales bacterium]
MGYSKPWKKWGISQAVAGVSAGSIVGTLYASGMDYAGMRKFIDSTSLVRVLFPDVAFSGLLSLSYLRDHLCSLHSYQPDRGIGKTAGAGLTNLNSGETEFWSEGPLRECVMASCAIPLVFQPIEIDGHLYVDGGLLMNFPVPALRSQCRNLIGVNLMPQIPVSNKKLTSGLSMTAIAIRSFYLSVINNTKPWRDQVEVLIEAPELYHYHISNSVNGRKSWRSATGYDGETGGIEKLVFSFNFQFSVIRENPPFSLAFST